MYELNPYICGCPPALVLINNWVIKINVGISHYEITPVLAVAESIVSEPDLCATKAKGVLIVELAVRRLLYGMDISSISMEISHRILYRRDLFVSSEQ